MKIVAITQARFGSTRLRGKVLKEINGQSLLEIHLSRILKSKLISKLIVATTFEPESDMIKQVAEKSGVSVYQGSLENVLDRYYQVAARENPDYIVRITSDCPLIDAELIDSAIKTIIEKKVDYVSNTLKLSYPDGVDVEVFTFNALKKAYEEAITEFDKEHVTPYIWRNSSFKGGTIFKSFNMENNEDLSKYRLTIDLQSDFELIERLVSHLGTDRTWKEYIDYINLTE